MKPSFNILLADDHVMFRRGIKKILQSIADVKVVGEASDGFEVLEQLKKCSPHLVILDISMPNLRGLEATREIKVIKPEVKVLILTMHKEMDYLDHAFAAGAEGFLLKEDADTDLLEAIQTMRGGGIYVSPLISTHLVDHVIKKVRSAAEQSETPREHLTTRERQIIKLAAEGKSSKEMGDLLFISSRTVQHHRANIMKKLNFKKTADLVRYAILRGYVIGTDLHPLITNEA